MFQCSGLPQCFRRTVLATVASLSFIASASQTYALTAPVITEFDVPTSNASVAGITTGPDGALWFTEGGNKSKIGRITTAGQITEYELPAASTPNGLTAQTGPVCIVAATDGNLWVSEQWGNRFTRITPQGVQTQFPNFATDLNGQTSAQRQVTLGYFPDIAFPQCMTIGPDKAIWVADQGPRSTGSTLGPGWLTRIAEDGTLTRFPVSTPTNSLPTWLATGSDGALWFTMPAPNMIGRMTTAGVVTSYTIPTTNSRPFALALGPDGAIWFTERSRNKIGRITVDGVITEYALPTANAEPTGIVAGPDGAMWFLESTVNRLGRITMAGQIAEFPMPGTTRNGALMLTVGPDNALWYTAQGTNKIGRAVLDPSGIAIAPLYLDPSGNLSYLRLFNPGTGVVSFTLTLVGTPSGRAYGATVYNVSPMVSHQVAITDVMKAAGVVGLSGSDTGLAAYITAPANGELPGYQHVVFNNSNRFFENASVCAYTPAVTNYRYLNQSLVNVHSSRMSDLAYPAQVSIHNTSTVANTFAVKVYDSTNGVLLGTVSVTLDARATYTVPVSWYEQQMGFIPARQQFHYNMAVLQNAAVTNTTTTPATAVISTAVVNQQYSAFLNMTSFCPVNPL